MMRELSEHKPSPETNGRLSVAPGYLYDGSSGPTPDLGGDKDRVPPLFHDVLYEAMRAGKVKGIRRRVDRIYRDLLIERGVSRWRAYWRYYWLLPLGIGAASRTKGPQYPHRSAK